MSKSQIVELNNIILDVDLTKDGKEFFISAKDKNITQVNNIISEIVNIILSDNKIEDLNREEIAKLFNAKVIIDRVGKQLNDEADTFKILRNACYNTNVFRDKRVMQCRNVGLIIGGIYFLYNVNSVQSLLVGLAVMLIANYVGKVLGAIISVIENKIFHANQTPQDYHNALTKAINKAFNDEVEKDLMYILGSSQGEIKVQLREKTFSKIELTCAILTTMPDDPVRADDGNIYSKAKLEEWYKCHIEKATTPMCPKNMEKPLSNPATFNIDEEALIAIKWYRELKNLDLTFKSKENISIFRADNTIPSFHRERVAEFPIKFGMIL